VRSDAFQMCYDIFNDNDIFRPTAESASPVGAYSVTIVLWKETAFSLQAHECPSRQ